MLFKSLRLGLLFVVIVALSATALPLFSAQPTAYAQTNTITIGTTDLPSTLDPAQANTMMSWEILRHIYVGLTQQVIGTVDYELALADSHTVSEDGLTHTFTIKEDAIFNDGTPINAETFAYSVNRVMTLDYGPNDILEDIGLSVEVGEAGELIFTTARPIPYFEALVALPMFFPVDANDFPASEVNSFVASINGNGVYLLDSWDVGTFVNLVANPNYAYGHLAKTENIVLQNYANTEALRTAMINHEVDVAWRDVLLSDADTTAIENDGIEISHVPSSRMWYLMLNSKYDYVDDPVVRESVMMTLDRVGIVESDFGGYLTPAYSLVPELSGAAYLPLWDAEPDVEAADQLMHDAGYRESRFNQAAFFIATSQPGYGNLYANPLATIISDTRGLEALTVTTNATGDLSAFTDALLGGDAQGAMFAWTPTVVHPDAYLRPLLHSEGPLAFNNNYEDEEIDALLDQAAAETDPSAQAEIYHEIQTRLQSEYVIAPLWQDTLSILTWDDISGVSIEANFYLHYDQLMRE